LKEEADRNANKEYRIARCRSGFTKDSVPQIGRRNMGRIFWLSTVKPTGFEMQEMVNTL
jgi:hypothetical protein